MIKNIRFMINNYLQSAFTYSSQTSGFPASNVYNASRSKVWKPAGNFEVTANNNLIYINDGSNKTATLTVGSYTYSTLAAHIQTQLNAVSTNWTCSYDSTTTYKFTINRSSGTKILRFSQTTTAAWDMLGYTQTVDSSSGPFVADEPRIHTSEWVKCDLGVVQQGSFVGIVGAFDEVFSLSNNADVRLQANNIDFWDSPPVNVLIDVDKYGALKFFDDDITGSYRYWRVVIQDRMNPLGPTGLEISYIYVGYHETVSLTNVATGFNMTLNDPSTVLQSETGALYFDTKPRYLSISGAQMQLLSGTELDNIKQVFYDLRISEPFFVSLDPGLEVSRSLGDLTRLMFMQSSPTFQHIIRDYYNINFEMREAF